MKLHAYEPSGPENLQSETRLHQKIESPIKALGVLHGRRFSPGLASRKPSQRAAQREVESCLELFRRVEVGRGRRFFS